MFHITSMLFQLYLKWQTLFKKGKHVLQFQYRMLIIVLLAINGRTCSQSGIPLLIPTVGIPLVGICYLFYVILYTSMICMIMHMVVLMNAFTEYPSKVYICESFCNHKNKMASSPGSFTPFGGNGTIIVIVILPPRPSPTGTVQKVL